MAALVPSPPLYRWWNWRLREGQSPAQSHTQGCGRPTTGFHTSFQLLLLCPRHCARRRGYRGEQSRQSAALKELMSSGGQGPGSPVSGTPPPPPGGKLSWHNSQQTEHLPIGKSGTLLFWKGLNHSLRADAGFQINLHKIGPILLEQQINSSFYRSSNQHLQPIKFNSKWADDQAFSLGPPSTHALPIPSS